jgi:WD40 repeat protein
LEKSRNYVVDLAYSPDGRTLISASKDGTARLWDPAAGRELATIVAFKDGNANQVKFSLDGSFIAVSSVSNNVLQLYETKTAALRLTIPIETNRFVYSTDGKSLYVAGFDDHRIHIFDSFSGKERVAYPGQINGPMFSIAVSPDGRTLAWCGKKGAAGSVMFLAL